MDPDPSFNFNAEPDPIFHFNADLDPDPDPAPHQRDANLRTLDYILQGSILSVSGPPLLHNFDFILIRIQLFTFKDPDPAPQNNADSFGPGSATLFGRGRGETPYGSRSKTAYFCSYTFELVDIWNK